MTDISYKQILISRRSGVIIQRGLVLSGGLSILCLSIEQASGDSSGPLLVAHNEMWVLLHIRKLMKSDTHIKNKRKWL